MHLIDTRPKVLIGFRRCLCKESSAGDLPNQAPKSPLVISTSKRRKAVRALRLHDDGLQYFS